jgi:hypothetical protein
MSNNTQCTLNIKASVSDLAPDAPAALAAWMKKFGKAESGFTSVALVADADAWVAAACDIHADGNVRNSKNCMGMGLSDCPSYLSDDLREFLREIVAREGRLADSYDVTPMLERRVAAITQREQDKAARIERERVADIARAEATAKEKEAKAAAEQTAKARMIAWINEHGSARLRRCMAEGIECTTAYRDERLAAERPGWQWDTDGEDGAPRNPPAEAFELLDEARATAPDAKLVYLTIEEEVDSFGDATTAGWRGYVAQAEFLGRLIRFGCPQ